MREIRVSVLCLAYNHEKYIRSALEGFVNQKTNFKYEVLINDDASTDGTADIIREYEKKYPSIIKPIYQKENQYSKNISIISKILLPKSQGDYIAFCEGDDYWIDENKLQSQFDALEAHRECSLAVHRVNCVLEDGTPNERTFPAETLGINSNCIIDQKGLSELCWVKGKYPFHTSSYFIKKQFLLDEPLFDRDIAILRMCLLEGCAFYCNTAMSERRLWTINNFNSRLREKGNEGKIELMLDAIKIDDTFDRISKDKYKIYTNYNRFECILNIANYDCKYAKSLFKEYDIHFFEATSVIHGKTKLKYWIKYFVLLCSPSAVYTNLMGIVHRPAR